jgi:hypothetical protein
MANFAITQQESLDSVNYLLSGPSNIGNDFTGKSGGEDDSAENFVYWPGDDLPPYYSTTVPVSPPPTDNYIATDMFVGPIVVQDAVQKLVVSTQTRLWADWTASTLSTYRFYITLARYRVVDGFFQPLPPLGSDVPGGSKTMVENSILLEASANSAAGGDLITNGSSGMVYANITDSPGTIGTYYYWLLIYLQPLTGNLAVNWIGGDIRSINASLVKP